MLQLWRYSHHVAASEDLGIKLGLVWRSDLMLQQFELDLEKAQRFQA